MILIFFTQRGFAQDNLSCSSLWRAIQLMDQLARSHFGHLFSVTRTLQPRPFAYKFLWICLVTKWPGCRSACQSALARFLAFAVSGWLFDDYSNIGLHDNLSGL
jgi:hypothetical protein